MGTTPDDRRQHARVPLSFDLEGAREPGGVLARMVARDLSLGGLYCTSTTDFPEMTRLAVRLNLPAMPGTGPYGVEPVDVEAVVVRRAAAGSVGGGRRFELALYFTSMTRDDREKIARFIARGA